MNQEKHTARRVILSARMEFLTPFILREAGVTARQLAVCNSSPKRGY
jgi:hypothetical protein